MIQALSILALVLAVALPVLDYVVFRPRRRAAAASVADFPPTRAIERLIYVIFLVALVGMALSGVASLAFGERMHGWMLILHMALAPLFSICVAGVALLWWAQTRGGEAVVFWLVIVASFVTITSALLGMMSWFGSDAQEVLLNLHRASAIILTAAAGYQAGRLLPQRATVVSL